MSLASCQQWMWRIILEPYDEKTLNKAPIHEGEIDATTRMGIYAQGYRLRLIECMKTQFRTLYELLGQKVFGSLALEYLKNNPSKSYTLHDLGRNFPAFLENSRPDKPDQCPKEPWFDALVDLALLERMVFETYEGVGDEGTESKGALRKSSSARLIQLRYGVHEYFGASDQQKASRQITPTETWLLVHRRDFRVHFETYTQAEARLAQRVLGGELEKVETEILAGAGPDGLKRWQFRNRQRGLLIGRLPPPLPPQAF